MTKNTSGSCGVGFVCNINGTKSHDIVTRGVEAVVNLTHRGAVGADGKTGDGTGVLVQLPKKFFQKEIKRLGFTLSHLDNLAVGFFFLYKDALEAGIDKIVRKHGLTPAGWRDVPVNDDALGNSALAAKPRIRQLFMDTTGIGTAQREVRLYLARRDMERTFGKDLYVPSFSSRTIVYKGMLIAPFLAQFYPDLMDGDLESAFCLFHQRFSTNTSPDWTLAQPFRVLGHNGEINTLQGNRNAMISLEHEISHEIFGDQAELLRPLISYEESDSASLDRIMELLMLSGLSPAHAITMCIPPAWEGSDRRGSERAFFEYHSLLMKPWDGPAAVAFTDGETVGAHMDRNGLRPLRYVMTKDGTLVLGSEIGMVDLGLEKIREKGRLGPGETIMVDLQKGTVKYTEELIRDLAAHRPYAEWMRKHYAKAKGENPPSPPFDKSPSRPPAPDMSAVEGTKGDAGGFDIIRKQIAFGYTTEEIQMLLKEMAETGKELIFSMGDDTPLPPLSEKPQLLFRYFRQRFSQVTNPPIDHIRERMVMSLNMNLGYKRNFLIQEPQHARRLKIESPILHEGHLKEIEDQKIFSVQRISITYAKTRSNLLQAVGALQDRVNEAVKTGGEIIILSDRDIAPDTTAIPSLLAVSSCVQSLRKQKLANRTSFIIETGEARDVHHMACLIGYGAGAIYPWLAYRTIEERCDSGMIKLSSQKARDNYQDALDDGLLKTIARMGISTLNSYHGAQLFDSICLNRDFVTEYFSGTPVHVQSDGLDQIEASLLQRHAAAFENPSPALEYGGALKFRKDGEWHGWSPPAVVALNKFMRSGEYSIYKEFSAKANEHPAAIKHMLTYKRGRPLPLEQVEPEENILKRFFSGAMSVGALSPEAHETIAEACNRLGIKSNSGEGGEDPERYFTIKGSAIKQIASGRFGVTPAYLASASDLEIKIAQGAKPGEGGHLPRIKVTEHIARLRHCKPGTLLISPPPHHDIYSIEDLAQLIYDLKQANPRAHVCVKLVAEAGVGTVAAGVAKAYADIVQISGGEGGTGAASVTSIKNAGSSWETGLAETQRVLMETGLRQKIRVRVDGGLKTGRDVIIAALLGAEEFGFGTATMIAAGCVMARQCHLNTCPTGVATQDEKLRARFRGTVEGITSYFRALAHEVREILAEMGTKVLDDIIGRTDLLMPAPDHNYPASERMNVSLLLHGYPEKGPRKCMTERNDNPAASLNDRLIADLLPFIEKAQPATRQYEIRNIHRSIPVKLNYHIAQKYKEEGLPPDTIRLTFKGTAGQSFGAFNHRGLSLTLVGDANDYAGKGMFGGRIAIIPSDIPDEPHRHVIVGNTVLYGATGGEFYASGLAGERFAVRNSGVNAVVEGAGHHLCEYMTRGTVVVLGEVGYNVGAGMTGGAIYVLDGESNLRDRINTSYVKIQGVQDIKDIEEMRSLIQSHHTYTGSMLAEDIISNFDGMLKQFKKVAPR